MDGLPWVAGGYLVGSFPSTWIVARARGAGGLIAGSRRDAGEADPHILMAKHMGVGWAAGAAATDVLKAFLLVLAARRWGELSPSWLGAAGVAVVAGHGFPVFARRMAGRGLAAAAGVHLVLLPVEMVIAGVLIVAGGAVRMTGAATTVAMASVPTVAAVRSQPVQLVAMAGVVFALLMIRRLEGVAGVVRGGVTPGRAVLYRCVFDSSGPPAPGVGRSGWSRPRRRRRPGA